MIVSKAVFCWSLFGITGIFFRRFESVKLHLRTLRFNPGIVIPPRIVFLFGDLTVFKFFGFLLSSGEHIEHGYIGHSPGLVEPQADFTVNVADFKAVQVLHGNERVHNHDIAVDVWNIQSLRADNLRFAIYAKQVGNGLDEQLQKFMQEHPDTKLIIIDTLQKIREAGGEKSSDYETETSSC